MAGFFLKPSNTTRGHSRSISLPVRSHPTTIKIEQELNNLILNLQPSPSPSSSSSISHSNKLCISISGLSELYTSVQELLKLAQTQQALSSSCSWADELLEEPLSFLDLCGNARDNISRIRETLGNLNSSLRRSNLENLTYYVSSLKISKREMAKSLASLKNIDTKLGVLEFPCHDQHLMAVVRVLRETSLVSSLVFRAVLGYFSGTGNSLQPKVSKWSLVLTKLVKSKAGVHDDVGLNEVDCIEAALNGLLMGHKEVGSEMMTRMVQSACKKVQVLEKVMEGFEVELEGLSRQLIQMRVALLNILSDH